jgi:hypothetical protein
MAYITIQDLRNEGVSETIYDDDHVTERITLACRAVEMLTGCFFEPKADHIVKLDGSGHDLLFLPYPPISTSAITELEISDEELDSEYWEVLMPEFPDGRFYPKIRHLSSTGKWTKVKSNIKLTGTFGFVEADGSSVPPMIKRLCIDIAILGMPLAADESAKKSGRIIEEQIKNYRYKLSEASSSGMFGEKHIDNTLALFYSPNIKVVR